MKMINAGTQACKAQDVRGERVHPVGRGFGKGSDQHDLAVSPACATRKKTVCLGGRNSIFVPMTGAPYLRDLDDVRRAPTLDDLATFHKLSHVTGPAFFSSSHRRADGPSCLSPPSAHHLFVYHFIQTKPLWA